MLAIALFWVSTGFFFFGFGDGDTLLVEVTRGMFYARWGREPLMIEKIYIPDGFTWGDDYSSFGFDLALDAWPWLDTYEKPAGFEGNVPLWLVCPPLALFVLLWSCRRRVRPGPGCCATCGYDLRGNVSGRCPECGAATIAQG